MREAMFYERVGATQVRCGLCRFRCLIKDGARGICAVRENRGGTLFSLVYGKLCAEHVDPIEKKPLFHVLPGSQTYSIATVGCNFHCRFCQNYTISQLEGSAPINLREQTPHDIVQRAIDNNCSSISYTYTEPTIFFEFAYDTARLARQAGLKNIFVTNGYISSEALATIAPYLDAANIDLKAFSEKFYRNEVHASLAEVLATIIDYRRQGIWLEITTLIIPGLNDSDADLQEIAGFIASKLSVDTPWHVSQFYPTYLMTDRSHTPLATLRTAREIGRAAGLRYVYEGNVPGEDGENTNCPACASLLITRYGHTTRSNRIRNGLCPDCGATIAGVGL
ncbi:MAG TPA: AmmeMemoRadiSam system radical SAM enzyme [Desulfuromonadales bacterium]|nr:AmmeMemoRadiSam system radical SAM enzyme [Desulfuromonadales bacterium]